MIVGDDRRLASAERLEEIALGYECYPLLPWTISRREVCRHVRIGPKVGLRPPRDHFSRNDIRFVLGTQEVSPLAP